MDIQAFGILNNFTIQGNVFVIAHENCNLI